MRKFCYAGFGVLLLLLGCNIADMDFSNLKLEDGEADLAVPFGTASYTMRELLLNTSPNLELEEDATTGEMWLTYTASAIYNVDGSIITIPPTDNTSTQTFPATPADVVPRSIPFTFTFSQAYSGLDGEFIDSVYFNSGDLILDMSTTLSQNISSYSVTIDRTERISNGTILTLTGSNLTSGSPANQIGDLAGHKSKFSSVVGVSNYSVTVTGTIDLPANEAIIGTEELTTRLQFQNQNFQVMFGKFGQDIVEIASQSIPITFFEDFEINGVTFGSAKINFDFRNSMGIPVGLGLSNVYGQDVQGVQTPLTGTAVNTPRVIQSSSIVHPVTGEMKQTLISVTRLNSNLATVLANAPTSLNFNLQGLVNYYDATTLNFLTDTSSIRTNIEVHVPMEVKLADAQYQLDFDIAGQSNLSTVDSAALRVVTYNEFPFSGTFDLLIIDASDQVIYTIADNQAFDQPFLNFDKSVREPKISTDDVPLTKAGLEAMDNGEKIRIIFTLNSPSSQTSEEIFVKILSTAKMEVTLGARIIIKTNL